MRRIAVSFCLFFLCFSCLCSCTINPTFYTPQEGIGVNYNNTAYGRFWLTNDSICYLNSDFYQRYVLVDNNSITKLGLSSSEAGEIQKYGEKVYFLDAVSSMEELHFNADTVRKLKVYDISSRKSTDICSITNYEQFFVLNETVYYSEYYGVGNACISILKAYDIASGSQETLQRGILSFGVVENALCYVIREEHSIAIYRYDQTARSTTKCGEFFIEPHAELWEDAPSFVSYTPNAIFFSWTDYERETSMICKYTFQNSTADYVAFEGCITEFVSYDAYSYFLTGSETDSCGLYCFNNETNGSFQIAEIDGTGSLFVGSDDGAYVHEHLTDTLKYYSNEGGSEIVYRFR